MCRLLEKVKLMGKSDDAVNESVNEDEDSTAVYHPQAIVDRQQKSLVPQDEGEQHALMHLCNVIFVVLSNFAILKKFLIVLQCFDTFGWAAGRASGL